MELFDCERAWAAGFYDGEGSTSVRVGAGTWAIGMGIAQNERELLDRFNAAIDNQADIYGPYERRAPRAHSFYQLQVAGLVRVKHAIAVLWPWLGSVKRDQAQVAILKYEARPRKGPLRSRLRIG